MTPPSTAAHRAFPSLPKSSSRNLSITVKEQKVKEGWLGKRKGMLLQILWGRGSIDSSKVVTARSIQNSKHGKNEDFGVDLKLKEAS